MQAQAGTVRKASRLAAFYTALSVQLDIWDVGWYGTIHEVYLDGGGGGGGYKGLNYEKFKKLFFVDN